MLVQRNKKNNNLRQKLLWNVPIWNFRTLKFRKKKLSMTEINKIKKPTSSPLKFSPSRREEKKNLKMFLYSLTTLKLKNLIPDSFTTFTS